MQEKIISLIIPPSPFLLDERVFMSLGILKIASVLEKEGHLVELIDLSGVSNYCEAIEDHVRLNIGKRIYGITATTPQIPYAYKISQSIRKIDPFAKQILGGSHVTLIYSAFNKEMQNKHSQRATNAYNKLSATFDVLVSGDGEFAIFEAIKDNSPKLILADNTKSKYFLKNDDLNKLPFPARHLLDVKSYKYSIDNFPALSLISQLGCPFSCGFCGGRNTQFLRKVRARSSNSIVSEMIHLYKTYGTKGFMLYDDELNINNNQMIELMKKIIDAQEKLGVEWRLRGFVKSQLFNDLQAKLMYEAGFRWILSGFESADDRILQNMNKKSTSLENTRCLEIAKNNNLKVKALMSIGHPAESYESTEKTLNWLLENNPEDFDVTIITSYPGSPYYDDAIAHSEKKGIWVYTVPKTGDKLYTEEVDYMEVANYYKGDPSKGYKSYVYTDYLTSEEIVKRRDYIETTVRTKLNIPLYLSAPASLYEHSMGQFRLPDFILKQSNNNIVEEVII